MADKDFEPVKPLIIGQYETLQIMAEIVNAQKRACSRGGDGLIPKDELKVSFRVWEKHERNIRDLMKRVRYGWEEMYETAGSEQHVADLSDV